MSNLSRYFSSKPTLTHRHRRLPYQIAYEDLMWSISQPRNDSQKEALSRIRSAYLASHEHLDSEFFSSVLVDLDTVVFDGWLKDYMLVSWEYLAGTPCCLSRESSVQPPYELAPSGSTRLQVRMAIYRSQPKEWTWGGILHEMLHVYFDLESEWHRLSQSHGPSFSDACRVIVNVLALDGLKVHHVDQGADLTEMGQGDHSPFTSN